MLTRSQVGQMLGAHKTTVRRLESSGLLRPVKIDGVHYFSRADVQSAAQARPQALSGPAFELFDQGKQPVQVVIALGADAEHVAALWRSYNLLLGNWVVQGPGSLRAWQMTFKCGEITPEKILKALELCYSNPRMRAELERLPA